MTQDDSDQQLVQRVQAGEKAAFDLLVRKYQHRVLKLVSRFVSDAAEAEDVAQEAFIKAYRALASFRGDSAFYTWLYRIAINTAKNALVSNRRRPVDFDLDLQDPEQYDRHARLKEGDTPEGVLSRRRFAASWKRRWSSCRRTCGRRSSCASWKGSRTRRSRRRWTARSAPCAPEYSGRVRRSTRS
jgi:RNA polymerase sigma factor RpoE